MVRGELPKTVIFNVWLNPAEANRENYLGVKSRRLMNAFFCKQGMMGSFSSKNVARSGIFFQIPFLNLENEERYHKVNDNQSTEFLSTCNCSDPRKASEMCSWTIDTRWRFRKFFFVKEYDIVRKHE